MILDLYSKLTNTPIEIKVPSNPIIKYDTKWLQTSLKKLVDTDLEVDGIYGKSTKDAVRKFQSQHNLKVDGWAGIQTTAVILTKLNES